MSIVTAQSSASWLGQCNPMVKFVLLFVVSLALLFLFHPAPVLICYVMASVAVVLAGQVPVRIVALAQLPFLFFGLGMFLVNALTRPGVEPWPDLPVRVTVEGMTVGAALALRGMLIGILGIGFLATTSPKDLLVSLMRQGRLSPRYAYAVLAGHRMLAAMPATWASIRAAQAVRAPLGKNGLPVMGLRIFLRSSFALLVTSIRSSERIALALESRGLGAGPRTFVDETPVTPRDGILTIVLAVGFAAGIGAGYSIV